MFQTLKRELVRYAAGQTMFCPRCEGVLDCRRTVVITMKALDMHTEAGCAPQTASRTYVLCATCYDVDRKAVDQLIAQERVPCTVEVDDGRTLWEAPKPRAPRKPRGPSYKVGDEVLVHAQVRGVVGWYAGKVLAEGTLTPKRRDFRVRRGWRIVGLRRKDGSYCDACTEAQAFPRSHWDRPGILAVRFDDLRMPQAGAPAPEVPQ